MQGIVIDEPVLFELGSPGRQGYSLNRLEDAATSPEHLLPADEIRGEVEGLP